jgi:hypothetical protein
MRIQERNYRSIVIFSDQDRGEAGFVRYEQIFLNCNAENQIVCTVSMEEGVTLLVECMSGWVGGMDGACG